MKTRAFRFSSLLAGCLLSSGCATAPSAESVARRPMLFHDTLLQYALLTDDRQTLRQDFQMTVEPSPIERVVAGAVLPFTTAIDTLYWPFSASIKSHLAEDHSPRDGKAR